MAHKFRPTFYTRRYRMPTYQSIEELVSDSRKKNVKISQLTLEDQAQQLGKTPDELYTQMEKSFDVMCDAVLQGQKENQRSTSGLTGGESFKMNQYSEKTGGGLCGTFMTRAMSRALAYPVAMLPF